MLPLDDRPPGPSSCVSFDRHDASWGCLAVPACSRRARFRALNSPDPCTHFRCMPPRSLRVIDMGPSLICLIHRHTDRNIYMDSPSFPSRTLAAGPSIAGVMDPIVRVETRRSDVLPARLGVAQVVSAAGTHRIPLSRHAKRDGLATYSYGLASGERAPQLGRHTQARQERARIGADGHRRLFVSHYKRFNPTRSITSVRIMMRNTLERIFRKDA
jgi:hypothetical protein